MNLKALPASCFRYNSVKKHKTPVPKMKLDRIDVSFPAQVLQQKFLEEFDQFISILHKIFLSSSFLITWLWLEMKDNCLQMF